MNELEKRIDEFYKEADGYLNEAVRDIELVTDPGTTFAEGIDRSIVYTKSSDKLQSVIDELYSVKKLLKQAEMMERVLKNLGE